VEKVVLGSLNSLPPTVSGPRRENHGNATERDPPHPSPNKRDMAVWKSNEPENWLFRMQFAKASQAALSESAPLIPIPEPTTGMVFLLGIAGRSLWKKYAAQ
jgi:hypothetical protein